MNWLDYLLLAILIGAVVNGVRVGLSRVVIGLLATVAGLILAAWFYGAVSAYIKPFVESESVAHIAAFLLVFIAVQTAGALLGWICSRIFKWTGLGWLDRLLGAAGGAANAALTAVVLVLIFSSFHLKPLESAIAGSRAGPYLLDAAQVLVYICPRELRDDFAEARDRILELWQKRGPSRKLPSASV